MVLIKFCLMTKYFGQEVDTLSQLERRFLVMGVPKLEAAHDPAPAPVQMLTSAPNPIPAPTPMPQPACLIQDPASGAANVPALDPVPVADSIKRHSPDLGPNLDVGPSPALRQVPDPNVVPDIHGRRP